MDRRVVLLVVLVVIAVAAWGTGLFDLLRDPERFRDVLLDWGVWGWVFYVGTFTMLEPIGIPGVVWIVPAALVWPKPLAFALSIAGAAGASCAGFLFARYLARDWVRTRLPERFHRFDAMLAERAFFAVILVRLVFFIVPPSHWVLGLSRVRFGTFCIASTLGLIPGVAAFTWLGGGLFGWLVDQPAWAWAAVIGVLVVAAWVRWRILRGSAEDDGASR